MGEDPVRTSKSPRSRLKYPLSPAKISTDMQMLVSLGVHAAAEAPVARYASERMVVVERRRSIVIID